MYMSTPETPYQPSNDEMQAFRRLRQPFHNEMDIMTHPAPALVGPNKVRLTLVRDTEAIRAKVTKLVSSVGLTVEFASRVTSEPPAVPLAASNSNPDSVKNGSDAVIDITAIESMLQLAEEVSGESAGNEDTDEWNRPRVTKKS